MSLLPLDGSPLTTSTGRFRRPLYVLGMSSAVAGLIIGVEYGGPARPFALLVSVLLGGLYSRQVDTTIRSRGVFGNIIMAITIGPVLGLLVMSQYLSALLGVAVPNVVYASVLTIVVNAVIVASLALIGFVLAQTLVAMRLTSGRSVGAGLFAVGLLGFAVVSSAPDVIPSALDPVVPSLEIARLLVGGLALVGFVSLLDTPERRRIAIAGTLAVSVALGGAGFLVVGASVGHARTIDDVSQRTTVTVTDAAVANGGLELTVRVDNPSDYQMRTTGLYVRTHTEGDATIGFGSARPLEGSVFLERGETATASYRLPLSSSQARQLNETIADGGYRITGRLTLSLESGEPPVIDVNRRVQSPFECTVGEAIEC